MNANKQFYNKKNNPSDSDSSILCFYKIKFLPITKTGKKAPAGIGKAIQSAVNINWKRTSQVVQGRGGSKP